MQPYDNVLSEANEILKTLKSGRFANSTIKHLVDFSSKKVSGLLIITDSYILYVEDCKHIKFKCPVRSVTRCEVFEEASSSSNSSNKWIAVDEEDEDMKTNNGK